MAHKSLPVKVGKLIIGGDSPVLIQSMTNTDTAASGPTLEQINALARAGCELVRVAVPDERSAAALEIFKKNTTVPLIADIHFDYRLALLSIEKGADKIRINPGNIGSKDKLARIAYAAGEKGIALRIGINAGSLERTLGEKYESNRAEALVESAFNTVEFLEHKCSFTAIVISLKANDVPTTVDAYEKAATQLSYPFHLGVTEAGSGLTGIIKSSIGIGTLLLKGIGDTIRVSLTGDPIEEITVAKKLLQAVGVRKFAPEIVSCPTCARCKINVVQLVESVEKLISKISCPIKIAVMGCPVNGPGEAREADIGISGGEGFGIIFKEGKVFKKIPYEMILTELEKEIKDLVALRHHCKKQENR